AIKPGQLSCRGWWRGLPIDQQPIVGNGKEGAIGNGNRLARNCEDLGVESPRGDRARRENHVTLRGVRNALKPIAKRQQSLLDFPIEGSNKYPGVLRYRTQDGIQEVISIRKKDRHGTPMPPSPSCDVTS